MSSLQQAPGQFEEQVGAIAQEILRIEAHLRRQEFRAASARIGGAFQQLQGLRRDSSTVVQSTLAGARLGLSAGGGSWLRGRLPAALISAIGGWMYGQSLHLENQRTLDQLGEHLHHLQERIPAEPTPSSEPAAESSG